MIKWLFGQYSFETTLETEEDENDTGEEEEELKLPVYKHSYLVDPIGNVTSDYYKGFIPWEAWYDGSKTVAKSNDSKIQWKTFEQLIKQFQADGIEVIFVEVPEYLDGRIEKQMEENNDKIEAFAKENGIEFYNYNEELASEINDDYTNYSDWGHLNTQGSTAFSKLLGEDLKEILK